MSSLATSKFRPAPQLRCMAKKRVVASRAYVAPKAFLNDVGSYLSKAAEQIFHPLQESDVPWSRSSEPFTGSIVHHEDTTRLTQLYDIVKTTRKSMETSAPGEAAAASTSDTTTTYQFNTKGELVDIEGTMGHYVKNTIERVFGHNFKGDENEPKRYFSSGYPASSGRRSHRDLQRDVDRLRRFESVVMHTIEVAEKKKEA